MNLKMKSHSKMKISDFKKTVVITVCVLLLGYTEVYAQSPSSKAMELSEQLHEYWETQEQVDQLIEKVTEALPLAQRKSAKEKLTFILEPDLIEELSIFVAADTFSEGELKEMLRYYGSEFGRSAEGKRPSYEEKLSAEIENLIRQRVKQISAD